MGGHFVGARTGVPFQSAAAPGRSLPTGLADGLGLESAPGRHGRPCAPGSDPPTRWFPRSRAVGRDIRLHCRMTLLNGGRACKKCLNPAARV